MAQTTSAACFSLRFVIGSAIHLQYGHNCATDRSNQHNGKVVAAYCEEWSIYGANYNMPSPRFPVVCRLALHPSTETFWTYDDPAPVTAKMGYVKLRAGSLGGAFEWAIKDDDENATLLKTMAKGLTLIP